MPKFIRLAKFTDQGIKNIKNLKQMVADAQTIMKAHGVTLEGAYSTLGPYDVVAVIEAPDAVTAGKVSALIASQGNFRAETMAAIPLREFIEELQKSPPQ